ncbi:MAG: hypothetical protein IJF41_01995, partial [Clostridia bacterium]|nr:hypothetical protein [Clostridia bacterium]
MAAPANFDYGGINMNYLKRTTWARKLLLAVMDGFLFAGALYLALVLRYDTGYNAEFTNTFGHLPEIIAIYLTCFYIGGIYDILWRYAGVNETIRLTLTALIAGGVSLLGNHLLLWSISRTVLCMLPLLVTALTGGIRMLWRIVTNAIRVRSGKAGSVRKVGPRLMVVGAGVAGAYVIQMAKNDPGLGEPILLVDDDPGKLNLRVQGVSVRGKIDEIPTLAERYQIQEIIIAIPSLRGEPLNR